MIKDITVNLSLGANDRAGDYAISLAASFDAHVLGVAVAYDPVIPAVMGGIPPEFIDAQRTEADERARVAVARFEKAAKRAGVSAESLVIHASFSGRRRLVRAGRRSPAGLLRRHLDELGLGEKGQGRRNDQRFVRLPDDRTERGSRCHPSEDYTSY